MALGADRASVFGMVMRQGLVLIGLGVVFGIAGALALTGWLSALFFEVEPGDPTVLAVVAATLHPRRRAGRISAGTSGHFR